MTFSRQLSRNLGRHLQFGEATGLKERGRSEGEYVSQKNGDTPTVSKKKAGVRGGKVRIGESGVTGTGVREWRRDQDSSERITAMPVLVANYGEA